MPVRVRNINANKTLTIERPEVAGIIAEIAAETIAPYEPTVECRSCNVSLPADRMEHTEVYGGPTCKRCRERYVASCYICNAESHRGDTTLVELDGEMRRVCFPCHESRFPSCRNCSARRPRETMTESGPGSDRYFCADCMERRLFRCTSCHRVSSREVREDGWEEPEPLPYCRSCFSQQPVPEGRVRIPARNASGQDDSRYDVHDDASLNRSRCHAPHREFTIPLKNGPVPQEQRIEVKLGDTEMVSLPAQKEIYDILRNSTDYYPEDDFDWVYKSPKGTAFTKRASQYYYKKWGKKITPDVLEKIGNIAAQGTTKDVRHVIDFTRHLSWNAGMFGDGGSCYWGGSYGGRCILKAHGGFAIRAWDGTVERAHGIGRAWIFPLAERWYTPLQHRRIAWDEDKQDFVTVLRGLPEHKGWEPVHDTGAGSYILFNGYGNSRGYDSLQFAMIFADMMGLTYKKVSFTNCGGTGGHLYINSGTGYLIGSEDSIKKHDSFGIQVKPTCDCVK